MGSRHQDGNEQESKKKKKGGLKQLVTLVTMALTVTAVVKELRLPADERTWNGVVAGFVPYDFRAPTLERFKERVWNPAAERLVGPRVFGVGWTVNVGKVVAMVREKVSD